MDSAPKYLLQPEECMLLMVDFQAGLRAGLAAHKRALP
jgi:hypothetical protein